MYVLDQHDQEQASNKLQLVNLLSLQSFSSLLLCQ
uniref:Uncharacterized protein n=1 Tax=Arundo donax TaxID=35708 RepID=A0A0A9C113_ARUDO